MIVRAEAAADHADIRRINDEAFGETLESELVDAIRASDRFVPELSIVAAPYRRAGEIVGALGVIGPTRMDYSRVIPLVEFTARTLGIALDPPDGE